MMKPCKRGHTSGRYPQGNCIECAHFLVTQRTPEQRAERVRKARAYALAHPEKTKKYQTQYRIDNAERLAAYDVERHKDPVRKASKRSAESMRRQRSDVKVARRAERMKRIADLRHRTPAWANLDAIKLVYLVAEQRTRLSGVPHHVDHFYPLNGKTVSGLHTSLNLRVIPARENLLKGSQLVN
jgi:hypothetical protein